MLGAGLRIHQCVAAWNGKKLGSFAFKRHPSFKTSIWRGLYNPAAVRCVCQPGLQLARGWPASITPFVHSADARLIHSKSFNLTAFRRGRAAAVATLPSPTVRSFGANCVRRGVLQRCLDLFGLHLGAILRCVRATCKRHLLCPSGVNYQADSDPVQQARQRRCKPAWIVF